MSAERSRPPERNSKKRLLTVLRSAVHSFTFFQAAVDSCVENHTHFIAVFLCVCPSRLWNVNEPTELPQAATNPGRESVSGDLFVIEKGRGSALGSSLYSLSFP